VPVSVSTVTCTVHDLYDLRFATRASSGAGGQERDSFVVDLEAFVHAPHDDRAPAHSSPARGVGFAFRAGASSPGIGFPVGAGGRDRRAAARASLPRRRRDRVFPSGRPRGWTFSHSRPDHIYGGDVRPTGAGARRWWRGCGPCRLRCRPAIARANSTKTVVAEAGRSFRIRPPADSPRRFHEAGPHRQPRPSSLDREDRLEIFLGRVRASRPFAQV